MEQKSDIIIAKNHGSLGIKCRSFIFLAILIALGVTVYEDSFYALADAVLHRYRSSHGIFVPFISGYVIWLRLDKIKRLAPKGAPLSGSIIAVAGVVLFIIGHNNEGIALPVLSFLLIAAGLILVLFGSQMLKEIGFPLFFLGAMIPVPDAAYNQIAEWMRQASTWGSVSVAKLLGVSLHRDGFNIFISDLHLYIDLSCSGIRYLISYLVFGVAFAFLFKKSVLGRAFVLIGAVPLSIVGGVLRLSVIFSTAYYIGPFMVEHRPHVLLSWSVFTILLIGVIGVDRYISGVRGQRSAVVRDQKGTG